MLANPSSHMGEYVIVVYVCIYNLGILGEPYPSPPLPTNSYSKDYDPEDWLQVDKVTGRIQTQRVLSPASPFLKDGWYRAIILALDNGEGNRWCPCPISRCSPKWTTDRVACEWGLNLLALPSSSHSSKHSHRHPVH